MANTGNAALPTDVEIDWADPYRIIMRPHRGKRSYWLQMRTQGVWVDVHGPMMKPETAQRELAFRAER